MVRNCELQLCFAINCRTFTSKKLEIWLHFRDKPMEYGRCIDTLPLLVMRSVHDRLFCDWGEEYALQWSILVSCSKDRFNTSYGFTTHMLS